MQLSSFIKTLHRLHFFQLLSYPAFQPLTTFSIGLWHGVVCVLVLVPGYDDNPAPPETVSRSPGSDNPYLFIFTVIENALASCA